MIFTLDGGIFLDSVDMHSKYINYVRVCFHVFCIFFFFFPGAFIIFQITEGYKSIKM